MDTATIPNETINDFVTTTRSNHGTNNDFSSAAAAVVDNNTGTAADQQQKILNDLNVVMDKMDTCQNRLYEQKGTSNTFSTNNELYDIIGFLEACAPRMVELVEFCAQQPSSSSSTSPISDDVLMKALEVNDRLIKTLADFEAVTFETDDDTNGDHSSSSNPNNNTGRTDQDDTTSAAAAAVATTTTTQPQSTSEDDFDAFLSVRTNAETTETDDVFATTTNTTSTTNAETQLDDFLSSLS